MDSFLSVLIDFLISNYITLLLLLGMEVILLSDRGKTPHGVELIRCIMAAVFLLVVLESFEKIVRVNQAGVHLLYIKTALEYQLYSGIVLIEILLIAPVKRKWVIFIPQIIELILILVSLCGADIIFSFDENYTFSGGSLHLVPYITSGFYLAVLVRYSFMLTREESTGKSFVSLFIVLSIIVTGFLEYRNIRSRLMDEVTAIDIMIYYFYFAMIHQHNMLSELHRKEVELEQSKTELMHTQVQLLQAQIQPHFIFNSLMAIQAQCLTAPDEVYNSIEYFSSYLRANLNAMTDTRLIPFTQEMDNIENYLSLERMNYGDRLQVIIDLKITDFMLPALTVQPLVENAVRHGIGSRETGGIITISTWKEPGIVVISVKDDGSGADGITYRQEKRRGIGLQNVQNRLRSMNVGRLDIQHTEHGTIAQIFITISYKEAEGNGNTFG